MVTSGTVGQTNIRVIDVIDHSILRCGIEPAKITGQMLEIARKNLFYYLSGLANVGLDLWTIEKTIIGLIPNQTSYYLPVGTIDVLNANYRTLTNVSGSVTTGASSVTIGFPTTTLITNVGVQLGTTTTCDLVWECFDGLTWVEQQVNPSQSYIAGQWYMYDIVTPVSGTQYRVREANGVPIDVTRYIFGNTPTEIPMSRLNRDEYASIPNKNSQSQYPTQWWYNRIIEQPQMLVWPSPTNTYIQLVVWRHRQIQDIGDLTNNIEIPQRWYECVLANISARNAVDIPGVPMDRILLLGKMAESAQEPASNEERDKSPIYATPPIGAYTRGRR